MTRKRFVKLMRSLGCSRSVIEGDIGDVISSKGNLTYKTMWVINEGLHRVFNFNTGGATND